jgi:uncharacterized protein YdcH (DUF465 family)
MHHYFRIGVSVLIIIKTIQTTKQSNTHLDRLFSNICDDLIHNTLNSLENQQRKYVCDRWSKSIERRKQQIEDEMIDGM